MTLGEFNMEISHNGNILDVLKEISKAISAMPGEMLAVQKEDKKITDEKKEQLTVMQKIQGANAKLSKTVQGLQKDVKELGIAFGASLYAINKIVDSTGDFGFNLDKISKKSGIAIESLQRVGNAYSSIANITTGEAQSDLGGLMERINQTRLGIADPLSLSLTGISVTNDTTLESAINDMRESLAKVSDKNAMLILNKAGISSNLLYYLRASQDEMVKMNKIPILTKAQVDNIMKMQSSFNALKKQLIGFKNVALAEISPGLQSAFNDFFELLNDNKDTIIGFLKSATTFVKDFAVAVGYAGVLIGDMTSSILGMGNSLTGLSVVLGGVLLYTRPLLALFVGIVAVLEDIQRWRLGKESAFGGLYDMFAKLDSIFPGIIKWIGILAGSMMLLGKFVSPIAGIGIAFASIVPAIASVSKVLGGVLGLLVGNPLLGLAIAGGAGIGYGIKKLFFDKSNDNSTPTPQPQNSPNDAGLGKFGDVLASRNNTVTTPAYTPANNQYTQSKYNTVEYKPTYNITVEAGDDREDIAEAITRKIKEKDEADRRSLRGSMSFGN